MAQPSQFPLCDNNNTMAKLHESHSRLIGNSDVENSIVEHISMSFWGQDRPTSKTVLANLWSDMGKIIAVKAVGDDNHDDNEGRGQGHCVEIVIKLVTVSTDNGFLSKKQQFDLERKIASYMNEKIFYERAAPLIDGCCRVPAYYPTNNLLTSTVTATPVSALVLENFQSEFPIVSKLMTHEEAKTTLQWLANFHAHFWGESELFADLHFNQGTYWHLDTRQAELEDLLEIDGRRWDILHKLGPAVHSYLDEEENIPASLSTLLHGDCKLANFQFSSDKRRCIGFDFQYAGRGVMMKDVVNLLHKTADEEGVLKRRKELVGFYIDALEEALSAKQNQRQNNLRRWSRSSLLRFMVGWKKGRAIRSVGVQAAIADLQPLINEARSRTTTTTVSRSDDDHGGDSNKSEKEEEKLMAFLKNKFPLTEANVEASDLN